MKILYYHQHFSKIEGSSGVRSYHMAKGLLSKGHSVKLICGKYDGSGIKNLSNKNTKKYKIDNIEVIELNISYSNRDNFLKRIWSFSSFILRGLKFIFTEEYDIIFATSTPLTVGINGIVAKIFRKKIFIFEVRDLWPDLPRAMHVIKNKIILKILYSLEKIIYKYSDGIIGLAPGIIRGVKSRCIDKNKPLILIPNMSDIDFYKNTYKDSSVYLSKSDFIAIFSGTHGLANGLGEIINVATELKYRSISNIKILLVGQGSQKKELIRLTIEKKLEKIILFSNPFPKKKLALLLGKADLGLQILSNIEEFYYGTSPNKFFDYIAAGLPVLVNYPGWVADMITEKNCGYFIPPNEPRMFAETLIEASKNKRKLKVMAKNSLCLAKEKFNKDKLVKEYVLFIEKVWAQSKK